MKRSVFFLFLLAIAVANASADIIPDIIPERRENPEKYDPGSLIAPVYSHIPGIGSTYGASLLANNLFGTRMNLSSVYTLGNFTTAVLGLTEVHLIEDTLVTSYYLYATKIPFQVFDRGMTSTPDNYFYTVNKEYGGSAEIDFNFWERRIQFNSQLGVSRLNYSTIAGADGVQYANQDAGEFSVFNPTFRFLLDFTDDNIDPREGVRLEFIRDQTLLWDRIHSQYYVLYGMATAYIPIAESSTWAFNVFRSTAIMQNINPSTQAQLQSQMSLNCGGISDPTVRANCQTVEGTRVRERFNDNQFGTAGQLGGPMALRGFALNRFHGSDTIFYATELRLNLSSQPEKFDFGFIKGTKTIVQIAPFFEMGAASDPPDAVEQVTLASSYGVGFRLGFSGAIVRADFGLSREGQQITLYVGYPWDMSPF